jgi:SAM-dependent methyltransferase
MRRLNINQISYLRICGYCFLFLLCRQMDKPWFKSWFASPYYHILYKGRDEKEAQQFLDNLIGFLKPQPGAKMLDIGCGRGRHAVHLSKKGFDVTGIDLSEESIEYDKQFETANLHFFVHDMRDVFKVDHFDYVFNLFSSFGYFDNGEDNSKTIDAHAQALKTNGKLVLDYMNAAKVCSYFVPSETKVVEGIKFSVKKKLERGKIIKQISFTDKGQDYVFREELSILYLDDFRKLLSNYNLKIANTFGDYSLNTFDRNKSDRLIIIAEKQSV